MKTDLDTQFEEAERFAHRGRCGERGQNWQQEPASLGSSPGVPRPFGRLCLPHRYDQHRSFCVLRAQTSCGICRNLALHLWGFLAWPSVEVELPLVVTILLVSARCTQGTGLSSDIRELADFSEQP